MPDHHAGKFHERILHHGKPVIWLRSFKASDWNARTGHYDPNSDIPSEHGYVYENQSSEVPDTAPVVSLVNSPGNVDKGLHSYVYLTAHVRRISNSLS